MRRGLLLMLALALTVPAAASASSEAVIRDCATNGRLTQTYSRSDLRAASRSLPADLQEYSNCGAVIDAAVRSTPLTSRRAAGGAATGGGPSGGGGAPPSAPRGLDAVPTPLLVLLAGLVVAAVSGAGLSLRNRFGPDRPGPDGLRRST